MPLDISNSRADNCMAAKQVYVIQFPPLNKDLYTTMQLSAREFEMSSGMDPLLYGGAPNKQMRSAKEAEYREAHLTSRPQDFADVTERWQSRISAKEAAATRLYVGPDTVAPLFREPRQDPANPDPNFMYGLLSQFWATHVNTSDPAMAVAELAYTVEAGTGQRKDKTKQLRDTMEMVQLLAAPILQAATATGVLDAANAMRMWNGLIATLGEAKEIPLGLMQMLPPPQQPPEESQNAPV